MTILDDTLIKQFLEEQKISILNQAEQLVAVTKAVAQIPWGEGRSTKDVLQDKKVGTCTGKHLVLQACYRELGIKFRSVVCVFVWKDQAIQFPDHIKSILSEGTWGHGHNFVQVQNQDGDYLDVDVTFDPQLQQYGFRTFPMDWNGKESVPIAFDPIIRRWDNADRPSLKEKLIDSLDEDTRERRERFLKGFIEWVDLLHSK